MSRTLPQRRVAVVGSGVAGRTAAHVAARTFVRDVTGAKLLETTMSQRPGWDEYAARVPLFVPRPPRG